MRWDMRKQVAKHHHLIAAFIAALISVGSGTGLSIDYR